MRYLILALLLLAWPVGAGAQTGPAGVWETPGGKGGKAHVRIEPCAGKLCGRIVWLELPNDDAGQPKTDRYNSDLALRTRPILGLPILNGFLPDPERPERWVDGRIYNPEDGETYRCTLTLGADGTMDVRGYVGLPLLGKTQVWKRVE